LTSPRTTSKRFEPERPGPKRRRLVVRECLGGEYVGRSRGLTRYFFIFSSLFRFGLSIKNPGRSLPIPLKNKSGLRILGIVDLDLEE
jgi:hypothetical protein